MRIRKIDTTKKHDVNEFIKFPFKLYQDDPYWVPPMIQDMRTNLNREQHPFFRHSTAEFFIAESEGQTLGRIAVLHNKVHNEYQSKKAAFFCYFDVIEDIDVARSLFDEAFDWAQSRGLNEITGPRGLLRFDGTGLLVKGYDYIPIMGIAYNFPYYDRFVIDSGFVKLTDYLSGYLRSDYELPEKFLLVAEKVKERKGYWIKTFNSKKELREWVPRIGNLFNSSFASGRDFSPINEDEMNLIGNNLISIAIPKLIKLVMKGEEIIGFVFAYPNVSEALQKTNGRLFPFGWITLMRAIKKSKKLVINGMGLLPKYQGLGGTALLYAELYKSGKPMGYEFVETVQVDEKNFKSMSEHENLKITWHVTHRCYVRQLS
jgi:hypothetical protein